MPAPRRPSPSSPRRPVPPSRCSGWALPSSGRGTVRPGSTSSTSDQVDRPGAPGPPGRRARRGAPAGMVRRNETDRWRGQERRINVHQGDCDDVPPATRWLAIAPLALLTRPPPARPTRPSRPSPSGSSPSTASLDNGLARTPPMGWNSWNNFGCAVNEATVRERRRCDGLVGAQGRGIHLRQHRRLLADARAADGSIVVDSTRFPHGIKALADYVHSLGLKLGIYSDAGGQDLPGTPRRLRPRDAGRQDLRRVGGGLPQVRLVLCRGEGQGRPSLGERPAPGGPLWPDARCARGERPADRVQPLQLGPLPAVAVGPRHRQPLAHHRRHPGYLEASSTSPTPTTSTRPLRGPGIGTIRTCSPSGSAAGARSGAAT